MMPLEIAPKIYDVGVVDWAVRDFHGYKTERGASYNSYLIMDEKICLIDTVKAMFAEELLAKIASRGMVNSAMTRMDDTARNLLYIGI